MTDVSESSALIDLTAESLGMLGEPVWSAAEAARRCGVGRATIQRALDSGKLPRAERLDGQGWAIPMSDLLAAGFSVSAPSVRSMPGQMPGGVDGQVSSEGVREQDAEYARAAQEAARQIDELKAELEVEHARRVAAEHARTVAELLAVERLTHLEDMRRAMRMIEAAPPPPRLEEAEKQPKKRRWWRRQESNSTPKRWVTAAPPR